MFLSVLVLLGRPLRAQSRLHCFPDSLVRSCEIVDDTNNFRLPRLRSARLDLAFFLLAETGIPPRRLKHPLFLDLRVQPRVWLERHGFGPVSLDIAVRRYSKNV